jgi:hypothetical protein
MRIIKTSTGSEIQLDGDLLSVMEALYYEVTAKSELERSFDDMVKEIQHLIAQMDDDELRLYLAESLFMNTVSTRTIGSSRISSGWRRSLKGKKSGEADEARGCRRPATRSTRACRPPTRDRLTCPW